MLVTVSYGDSSGVMMPHSTWGRTKGCRNKRKVFSLFRVSWIEGLSQAERRIPAAFRGRTDLAPSHLRKTQKRNKREKKQEKTKRPRPCGPVELRFLQQLVSNTHEIETKGGSDIQRLLCQDTKSRWHLGVGCPGCPVVVLIEARILRLLRILKYIVLQ